MQKREIQIPLQVSKSRRYSSSFFQINQHLWQSMLISLNYTTSLIIVSLLCFFDLWFVLAIFFMSEIQNILFDLIFNSSWYWMNLFDLVSKIISAVFDKQQFTLTIESASQFMKISSIYHALWLTYFTFVISTTGTFNDSPFRKKHSHFLRFKV